MRFASITNNLVDTFFVWLLLALVLPSLVHSAATSSDKATHDGLRKLTAANFTLTNQGAWLIEFFSPNCIHCKRFGATWSELSQNKDILRTHYPQAPFTLAQVDCLAQWDLCKEQGVTFLPRLTIYQDGKQNPEEYKGDRNYPEISAYIDNFAKEYRQSKGVADLDIVALSDNKDRLKDATDAIKHDAIASTAAVATSASSAADTPAFSTSENAASASSSAVQAIEQVLPSGPNPKGQLISFGSAPVKTKEELAAWLDKSSGQGPTFVKFFAPWCPHCKAMAAAFKQLSESLKGRVNAIEVDCEANHVLCASYDIRGYPVLRLYDQGHVKEYNGGRNHDAMLKWALKAASSSGLKPISSSTELASLAKDNEVMFLYLHSPGTPVEEVHAVEAASQILFGYPTPIYISSESELLDRYADVLVQDRFLTVPAKSGLLVFKDRSVAQPISVLNPSTLRNSDDAGQAIYTDDARAQIASFLSRERYALVTELTAANFEEIIRNGDDALVVLAALSDTNHGGRAVDSPAGALELKELELSALKSTALEWRNRKAPTSTRQVVFAWIDADRWKSPLKKLYNIDITAAPAAVLVEGFKTQYFELRYNSNQGGSYQADWISNYVFESIDSAIQGNSLPKSSRTLFQKSVRGAENYMNILIDTSVAHPIAAFAFVFSALGGLFFYLVRAKNSDSGSALPMYSKVSTVKAD
ncbi:probable Pig2 - related to protein disulfide isomerase [Melanopsichium pennsylvanicum]|uniref:Related to protein disulfide isomerase n=2 Tax=Melanopsichium pennsylvanicum TaxID=63383 RepID=A0A077RC15_9BASI|nr:related to protein disulfide isomerase [Melanopsichium pennsylvanicum 4]SNX87975.1 probable Pig2 - related to protein disulfide isomerase [Melanopsichium pennsylvanicum]